MNIALAFNTRFSRLFLLELKILKYSLFFYLPLSVSVHVLSVDVKAWTPNLRANESDIVSLYLMLETNTSNYGTTSKWKKKTVRGMAKNLLEKIAYFRIPCYSWNLGFKFSRGCQALSISLSLNNLISLFKADTINHFPPITLH